MFPRRNSDEALAQRMFWSRHASPWSVWLFVMAYPVLILAVYRRDRSLLAGTLLSVVANIVLVSPPQTDEAWATRVVLGEQVWIEHGILSEKNALLVTTAGAMVHLYTLRSALNRRPVRTAVGTVVSLGLMFLFFDRMVRLYDNSMKD